MRDRKASRSSWSCARFFLGSLRIFSMGMGFRRGAFWAFFLSAAISTGSRGTFGSFFSFILGIIKAFWGRVNLNGLEKL